MIPEMVQNMQEEKEDEKVTGGCMTDSHDAPNIDTKEISSSSSSSLVHPPSTPDPLPYPRYARFRWTVFTVYRRLFSTVFVANLIAFIYAAARNRNLEHFVNAAAINLLGVGLARHALVVNLMFDCLCSLPRSAPLWLRRLAAKIFHYGGIHSGCGVSTAMWYIGFIVLLSMEAADPGISAEVTPAILTLAWTILLLLLAIIIAAYPVFRFKNHNWFEFTHRFSGWIAIGLFWPLLFLFAQKARGSMSLGGYMTRLPAFWIIIILTMAIIHPWLYLRKVPVVAEPISSHAIRLHFDFMEIKFGKGFAISRHPLRDWHGFAQFGDLDGKGFSALVSKVGDWTTRCIEDPPTHVWKRGIPITGFGYCMKMFRSFIIVTTGSGIGPCLSFILLKDRPPMRVMWQTRSPLKTYGQGILDCVSNLDPNPVIIDSDKTGKRQDMLPLILDLVKHAGAEAVLVVSNPVFTRRIIFELEARNIPAYGPLFDS